MRWCSRRDWLFAIGSVALVPLMYLASFTVFETSDAYSSSGGRRTRQRRAHGAGRGGCSGRPRRLLFPPCGPRGRSVRGLR